MPFSMGGGGWLVVGILSLPSARLPPKAKSSPWRLNPSSSLELTPWHLLPGRSRPHKRLILWQPREERRLVAARWGRPPPSRSSSPEQRPLVRARDACHAWPWRWRMRRKGGQSKPRIRDPRPPCRSVDPETPPRGPVSGGGGGLRRLLNKRVPHLLGRRRSGPSPRGKMPGPPPTQARVWGPRTGGHGTAAQAGRLHRSGALFALLLQAAL